MRQFAVTDRITHGTVVDVLFARHASTGERVIIETSRPDVALTPELVKRLHAQDQLRRGLDHPNVIKRAGRCFSSERRECWFSEAFRGEPLRQRLQAGRRFSLEELLRFSISLSDALGYLHRRGLVHGSVSPEYIFCDTDRFPVAAKLLDSSLSLMRVNSSELKISPNALVRPEYLAPERLSGQRCTPASDIYSLGIVLFELANQAPPFVHADERELRKLHIAEPAPPLPTGFKSLQLVVHRCLAKAESARYRSALEVRDELDGLHRAMAKSGALKRETGPRPPRIAPVTPPPPKAKAPPLPKVSRAPAVVPNTTPEPESTGVSQLVRKLAGPDGVPTIQLRYRSKRVALSWARPMGSQITLHVPANSPAPLGDRVRVQLTVDDLIREFVLEGTVIDILQPMVNRNGGFLLSFDGIHKRSAAELLALCADRPAAMGTATSPRVNVRRRCSVKGGRGRHAGQVEDLSRTGAFISLPKAGKLNVGDRVSVQLGHSLFGLFGGWVSARVVWRGEKNTRLGIGVRFSSEDTKALEQVKKLYDSVAARRG